MKMGLSICDYLKEHGLDAAVNKWSLKTYAEGDLLQLNYHMIDSPTGIKEVDECRGLIVDAEDFDPIAFAFNRFYNQGEPHAAKINLETSQLFDKLDGTLIIVYCYNGWKVATRGRPLADGNVNKSTKTFKELFDETLNNYQGFGYNKLNKHYVYAFELCGPENRVLTLYEEKSLHLLAARNMDDLEEIEDDELDEISEKISIPRPKRYSFNSLEDIQKIIKDLNPVEEGFVLTDYGTKTNGSFYRIKIKNPRYLALSHLLNSGESDEILNKKKIFELMRLGEISEVIAYFPEYKDEVNNVQKMVDQLISEIDETWERLKHLAGDRKSLAAEALKTKFSTAIFLFADNKISNAREFVMEKAKKDLVFEMMKGK